MTIRATSRANTLNRKMMDSGKDDQRKKSASVDSGPPSMHVARLPMEHGGMGSHDRDSNDR